jgi:uncharacterized protein
MGRPKIPRNICGQVADCCFKPNGIPMSGLDKQYLEPDELEAIRLVDFEGMLQQEAAIEMRVSRQTLANLVKAARLKVADCLINGKALIIGDVE